MSGLYSQPVLPQPRGRLAAALGLALAVMVLALGLGVYAVNGGRLRPAPPQAALLVQFAAAPADGGVGLSRLPGVAGVQMLSAEDIARLLAPWLGAGTGGLGKLVPAARLTLLPGTPDAQVQAALAQLYPSARSTPLTPWRAALQGERAHSQGIGLALAGCGVALAGGIGLALGRSLAGQAMGALCVLRQLGMARGPRQAMLLRQILLPALAGLALGAVAALALAWGLGAADTAWTTLLAGAAARAAIDAAGFDPALAGLAAACLAAAGVAGLVFLACGTAAALAALRAGPGGQA